MHAILHILALTYYNVIVYFGYKILFSRACIRNSVGCAFYIFLIKIELITLYF